METSNWRPNQGGSGGDSSMESGDWRTQLPADSRQKIVNKIMDSLKKHLPFAGQDKLNELKNIAVRFEEKTYTAATCQSEYMRKISMKMLTMENRSPNPMPNSLQSSSAGSSINPSDPGIGSQGMRQVNNQGQPLPIPVPSSHPQAGQQILSQSIHNNIASSGVQGSAGVSSGLPPGSGLPQPTMPNVAGQSSSLQNIQNISGVQQNSVGNNMGQQGVPPGNFVNQRPIPGRQQLATQQQSQNSHHYLYQQQLHQIAKQKLQQNNIATSMQSHIQQQQQNLLQPSHFQPSQQSIMQPTLMQPSSLPGVQQNQQPIVPQSTQPLIQHHHQQSVLRQQRQQQQAPIIHQQQVLPTQQQQPQPNLASSTNMQQNQLIGQKNSYSDMQQRLPSQQNNLPNMQQPQHSVVQHNFSAMHQQHSGPQSSAAGQQQQQLLGTQSGNSGMLNNQPSAHLLQSKVPIQQQNLPTQGQQSQPQLQQQVISQLQTQSGQLQHHLNMKPQPNLSQRDMQLRLPTSGAFQQQNVIDQQKQLFQQQRAMPEASSTSSDSTAQTGNPNGGDWQEEMYQKMKALNDTYMSELEDMYRRLVARLQPDSLPQQPKEQVDKLKMVKQLLENCMKFLQVPKSNITPNFKENIAVFEKRIHNLLSSHKRKPGVPLQQAQAQGQTLPPPHMHPLQQSQQTQSHLTKMQPHENQMNSQMAAMQQNNMGNLQHNSVSNAQQNMMGAIQPTLNLDTSQNNMMNINSLSSQGGMGPLQPNSNMLQHQQLRQFQNRQMQQQFLQKQLLQQQFHRQTKQQQQNGQFQANQLPQTHPINDGNELKLRQQMVMKPDSLQQQQRTVYHPQLKHGAPFSPQTLQASSPQIDQQNLLNSLTKSGTPLQSANSPFIVPSPSTPSTSMPGEFEKVNSGVSSLSNAGNTGNQPIGATLPAHSPAIGTPGISASPLLAEFTTPDGNNTNGASASGKSSAIEEPIEHLIRVVKSMSSKALSASVSDISSVVSMVDRIAGSTPGNGSRAAVGEDLVAMTKCRLQARTFVAQDGTTGTRKMRRFTSAMPINALSSASSVNDSFMHLNCVETSELESTATSTIKRPRNEAGHALLDEIRVINRGLVDTVVDISEEDADSEGGEGTVVNCSFRAIALCPTLKSRYASGQMSRIQPLRLLVPANYPNCSPILFDKLPAEVSKECEDLSIKAKSRLSRRLRTLSQPLSLEEMVRTWDVCVRVVISDYAQQNGGGGTFSSKYGAWNNCLSAS